MPLALFEVDAERVRGLGRAAASALWVFGALRARPATTINDLATRAGVAYPTVARAVEALTRLNIVREITGRSQEPIFAYDRYVRIFKEGADPL